MHRGRAAKHGRQQRAVQEGVLADGVHGGRGGGGAPGGAPPTRPEQTNSEREWGEAEPKVEQKSGAQKNKSRAPLPPSHARPSPPEPLVCVPPAYPPPRRLNNRCVHLPCVARAPRPSPHRGRPPTVSLSPPAQSRPAARSLSSPCPCARPAAPSPLPPAPLPCSLRLPRTAASTAKMVRAAMGESHGAAPCSRPVPRPAPRCCSPVPRRHAPCRLPTLPPAGRR